jgi:hypothetical protein
MAIDSQGRSYSIDKRIADTRKTIEAAQETLAKMEPDNIYAERKREAIADAQERLERFTAERERLIAERGGIEPGQAQRAPEPASQQNPSEADTDAERMRQRLLRGGAGLADEDLIARLTEDQRKEFAAYSEDLDRQLKRREILPMAADLRKRQALESMAAAPATALDARIPPEDRARPVASPLPNWLRTVAPHELLVDAKRFQFKSGADEKGVTDRLRGVTEWNPIKAGMALVWEDRDGKFYVVDGHQRLALAARIAAEDPAQRPQLLAYVLRQSNGVSARAARVAAALKNVAEGTGTAVDAAKVLRDEPDLVDQLPPRSELVRQARGLANLSDEAFLAVIDEQVPANYAAVVGRLVPNDANLQRSLLHVLQKADPANVVQAEAVVRQGIEEAGVDPIRADLFSDDDVARSLYVERAKVLDLALKDLKRDKTVFAVLSRESERIQEAGNVLAVDVNERRLAADATAIQVLQILAGRVGRVSDALSEAARIARAEGRPGNAVREFAARIRGMAASGDLARLADGASRGPTHVGAQDAASLVDAAPERAASRRVEQQTASEIRDVTTPPVNPATGTQDVLSPVEAQDVLKGAIGRLIEGRPVRAGEQIEATRAESARSRARPPTMTAGEMWARLAKELLPHEDQQAVEAARAAEAAGEPASVAAEPAVRARAAAKLSAESAEQYESAEPFLIEEERDDRAAFDAAMQEYDREQQRRAEIVQRGVACLMSGGFDVK